MAKLTEQNYNYIMNVLTGERDRAKKLLNIGRGVNSEQHERFNHFNGMIEDLIKQGHDHSLSEIPYAPEVA